MRRGVEGAALVQGAAINITIILMISICFGAISMFKINNKAPFVC